MGKKNEGKLVIFSAPSGAGKTTLAKHLLSQIPRLSFSVSACSRKQRPGEVNGKDYYFLSIDDFKQKISKNEFVEYEEVYKDHFYGTLFSEIERIWNEGKDVLFDVDVKGGVNIKKIYGQRALAVFIRPPSLEVLRQRLKNRATDSAEDIEIRLQKAEYELSFVKYFDVVITNGDFDKAKAEAISMVSQFLENETFN